MYGRRGDFREERRPLKLCLAGHLGVYKGWRLEAGRPAGCGVGRLGFAVAGVTGTGAEGVRAAGVLRACTGPASS